MTRACPLSAPPRGEAVRIEDYVVYVTLSDEGPNLPPGLTVGGAS